MHVLHAGDVSLNRCLELHHCLDVARVLDEIARNFWIRTLLALRSVLQRMGNKTHRIANWSPLLDKVTGAMLLIGMGFCSLIAGFLVTRATVCLRFDRDFQSFAELVHRNTHDFLQLDCYCALGWGEMYVPECWS